MPGIPCALLASFFRRKPPSSGPNSRKEEGFGASSPRLLRPQGKPPQGSSFFRRRTG
jgi:hypothetical protein